MKRKLYHIITLTIGIWLATACVLQFSLFLAGYAITENSTIIAISELSISVAMLIYLIWRFIKLMKELGYRRDKWH